MSQFKFTVLKIWIHQRLLQCAISRHLIISKSQYQYAELQLNPLIFDKTITWEIVKQKITSTIQAL
jgi:hypothetical protein